MSMQNPKWTTSLSRLGAYRAPRGRVTGGLTQGLTAARLSVRAERPGPCPGEPPPRAG